MLDYVVSKVHEQGPREQQQDTLGMVKVGHSIRFIVIDGMGGTQSGLEAAERVLESFKEQGPLELVAKNVHSSFQSWLEEEFSEVDVQELPGAVGTVLEIDLRTGQGLIYHLGDTRLYIGSSNGFEQVTIDHVDVDGKVIQDFGLPTIDPFIQPITVSAGIQFLLCTDGLYEALDDNDILDLTLFFQEEDVDLIAKALIEERSSKFNDNASAYVIKTLEKGPVKTMAPDSSPKNSWKYTAIGLLIGLLVGLSWGIWSDGKTLTESEPSKVNEGENYGTTSGTLDTPNNTNNRNRDRAGQPLEDYDTIDDSDTEKNRSRNVNRAIENSVKRQDSTSED